MANYFYLVQRGQIRDNFREKTNFLSGSNDAIVYPDYMGAAEFEFGAIPRAYRRILRRLDEYKYFDTGIYTIQGKKLYIICIEKYYDEILAELIKFVKSDRYLIKEWLNFKEQFKFLPSKPSRFQIHDLEYYSRTDFWWCIDKIEENESIYINHVGDSIWFVSKDGEDLPKKFFEIFKKDKVYLIDKKEED